VVSPVSVILDRTVAATGTIRPRDELIVGSDAAGVRLMEVLAEAGTEVRKGQLLARGDDALLRAQLAQADASVRQAQVEAALARDNLARAERLQAQGFYSIEAVETRRSSAESARAKVDVALAQRQELEVQIGHTRIVAPANGVISAKAATVGAVIQPGVELFRMIKDGEVEWLAELPSHSLIKVEAGTPARITLDDGTAVDASVRLVAPTIDANTRNGLVHVQLPHGARFKAGAHARGEILVDKGPAIALPERAVFMRDGYSFVYVVGDDGVARLTRVETGARQRGLVELSSGLAPAARVVSTGGGFVKDGDLVRITTQDSQRIAQAGEKP
jgi:RND family efflux transporter MFP subunit